MIIFLYGGTNMRLSSGWEQSVYVLLMLNQLPEGKYINTISLSERLEVSDSYLKKIIKLLDNEGLVKSVTVSYTHLTLPTNREV